jgi:hypothetical protein
MDEKRPFLDYLRHAFYNPYNYGLMLLFGGLTLIDWNWGWLCLGAGAEACFLYMLTTNPRFQRHVESQVEDEEQVQVERLRDSVWSMIDVGLRQRYQDLEQLTAKIRKDVLSFSQLRDPLLKENVRKVSTLLASFLKLCVAISRYRHYLSSVDPGKIQQDIDRLAKECEDATPRIAEIKGKNIDVLKARLEKNNKANANVEYLSAQLETIEDTMRLVVDQAVTLSDPKGMSIQIDSLLDTLKDTELIAAEIDAYDELDQGYSPQIPDLPPRQKMRQ